MADGIEVDISPEVGGSAGRKTTVFQETEWRQILENPSRLTKEGVEKKIELWKQSSNGHTLLKYKTMLKSCKNFAPSGITKEGKVIYARDVNGDAHWISEKSELSTKKAR
jgi:hypothetical protein